MRWRLRSQLLLPLVLLLLGVAGVTVWTALASVRVTRRQIEDRLRNAARYLSEELHYPLSANVLAQMKPLSGADYLRVPTRGRPVTSLPEAVHIQPPGPVRDDWHEMSLGAPVRIAGQTYLCSGIRLRRGPNAGDTLYVLYPESLWRDALWRAVRPFVVLGGTVGVASLLLAVGLSRQVGRRLVELERRTRLIAGGDFSPMPLPPRDDEIRDLTFSVNEMAQQLAQFQKTAQQTERLRLLGQVSGGLAHQLRNGLTGARLAVQLHLRSVRPGDDVCALEVALRQLTLLEGHVKRFLDLGREPGGEVQRQRCDLGALVANAVDLVRPQCRHAGITLAWEPPTDPAMVEGDPGQLGQLLLNLLGNALDAAGPGGQVWVHLKKDEGESRARAAQKDETPTDEPGSLLDNPPSPLCVLEVLDSGPGPPAALGDRLFEPFVTGKPDGVGLGLAVARQVAEAHGGRITWERQGRTCFRVELPAA
jgi:signal transduction histidine kinase